MQLENFLDQYNAFNVNDEHCSHYVVIHTGTEEVWTTMAVPVTVERVRDIVNELASNFPKGKNSFRLQAMSSSKVILGQIFLPFQGQSSVGRDTSVGAEAILHQKALAAMVSTTEQQLAQMQGMLDMTSKRATDNEEVATNSQMEMFKMMNLVHTLVMEREDRDHVRAVREAEIESARAIANTLVPLMGPLVVIAGKFLERKLKQWDIDPDEVVAASQQQQKAN